MSTRSLFSIFVASSAVVFTPSATAAIVFSELDFANDTITLHNNAGTVVNLDGWRFCSHDSNQAFVYSSTTALNGMSVAANGTLTLNISSFNFTSPYDVGNTMSIGLYTSSNFSSATDLEAFIQFTPTGNTVFGSAETRTGTAVTANVWDATGSFVQVDATDTRIVIRDVNVATGASSFDAVPEPSSAVLAALGLGLLGLRRRRVG